MIVSTTSTIEGRPARKPEEKAPEVGTVIISPRFFDSVGVQLRRGRAFHDSDGTPGNETTIINEKLAATLFAKEDPIGRRIRFVQGQAGPGQPPPPVPVWRTIVGISPTIRRWRWRARSMARRSTSRRSRG